MRMDWASDQSLLVRELDDALGLFQALHRELAPGVTDLSPARRSVLVRFDLRVTDHEAVEQWVRGTSFTPGEFAGRHVEIGVRYDGPDLAEVAAAAGLRVDEVIAMHSGTEYIAFFLGFAPGFA
jgi:allophanate hydrolase subunit 1